MLGVCRLYATNFLSQLCDKVIPNLQFDRQLFFFTRYKLLYLQEQATGKATLHCQP